MFLRKSRVSNPPYALSRCPVSNPSVTVIAETSVVCRLVTPVPGYHSSPTSTWVFLPYGDPMGPPLIYLVGTQVCTIMDIRRPRHIVSGLDCASRLGRVAISPHVS